MKVKISYNKEYTPSVPKNIFHIVDDTGVNKVVGGVWAE